MRLSLFQICKTIITHDCIYVLCNDVTNNWGFPIMSLGKSHPAIFG